MSSNTIANSSETPLMGNQDTIGVMIGRLISWEKEGRRPVGYIHKQSALRHRSVKCVCHKIGG